MQKLYKSYSSFQFFLLTLQLVFILSPSTILTAKPIIEKHPSFLIDWTALRIRFSSQVENASKKETWLQIKERTIKKGLIHVKKEIISYWNQRKLSPLLKADLNHRQYSLQAAEKVTRTTYSTHTYFQNKSGGRVKVELESRLSGLFTFPKTRWPY